MIPAAFDYVRAESAGHALELLAEHGDGAKLLAGGHSLIPLMKFRLAAPAVVVDIGRITDLSYVRDEGTHLAIGALTRHCDIETSDMVGSQAGLLAAATSKVGDPQVRHRGTIGGAIAHGDPASDIPAALLALRATMVVDGPDGQREVSSDDFFTGFLETAIGEQELLTEIRVPKVPDAGWSFQKFNRRAQDWAIVGAAVLVDNGSCGVGLVNMDSRPVRAAGVESAIAGGAGAADAAASAADGLEPPADLNAGVEYRQHLARVLTRRGLEEAGA
ncbi:MAG: xanthine dehydrogenase family protein subunit M [Acidimicrobiales bacterium]|nr:carbon monoxide dehydrogenase [Acidimicrobiaceae bacterium]MDP6493435.1 xanthine dehydrogenase family protein subunit M [Acidimicrobiales bacterium]MDP6648515.1 xanthine dehydrogenase family protein subunit M [Acidimicrobiales bacterium]MDP6759039.1 xanthine dehydrogenase family protein subunit M [Acidimicrobiales bacterium]